jgi:hypothetical protein
MTAPANCPICLAAAAADPTLAGIEARDGKNAATFAINAAFSDVHGREHDTGNPKAERRILLCRACGKDTGIPGAYFCDDHRPTDPNHPLLGDVDLERLAR